MYNMIALSAWLIAASVVMSQRKETEIVIDFCETILQQSRNDTSTCYAKPADYDTDNDNDAILIYLCCLNYFGGVTHDYMPFLEDDFVHYIAQLTNDKQILDLGRFVMACKSDTRKLTKAHFLSWLGNGKTAVACPAK